MQSIILFVTGRFFLSRARKYNSIVFSAALHIDLCLLPPRIFLRARFPLSVSTTRQHTRFPYLFVVVSTPHQHHDLLLCLVLPRIRENNPLPLSLEMRLVLRLIPTKIFRVILVPGRSSTGESRCNRVLLWQGGRPPLDHRCKDEKVTSAIFVGDRGRLAMPSCRTMTVPSFKANYKTKRPHADQQRCP